MISRTLFLFICFLVCSLPLTALTTHHDMNQGTDAQPDWIKRSNENAQVLLNVMAKYSPESAGQLGVDGYDKEVMDLKPNLIERSTKDTKAAIAILKQRLSQEKNPNVKEDLEILIKTAEDNIRGSELNQKYQLPYFDMAQAIFFGLRSLLDDQIPAERRSAALTRLQRYAGLDDGYTPLTVLAIDRTREQFTKKGLLGPIKAEVQKSFANEQFYIDGIGQLFEQFKIDGYKEPYAKLKEQLAAYHEFVEKEILPKTREDFKLPKELYAFSLEQFGVDMKPADLASKARAAFKDIQRQMQELAKTVVKEQGMSATDYRDVIKELKKNQLVGDTILPFYQNRIAEIEAIVKREHLVTLPERAVRIRIASPAEAAATPAPNMHPPRMLGNTGEIGEFVLPLTIPAAAGSKENQTQKIDDFTFAAASWTLSAHEARPGHELQYASIIEKGVSITRAIFAFNSANVEGWGLYSEAILRPYMPNDGRLISLQHLLLRAARAFLDPELHMGKITKEEALNILKKDVVVSDAMANQEVERYTFRSPGQATSYFYGYTKLQELRKEASKQAGASFNQQQFHDLILAQGLLPPALMKKAVLSKLGTSN